MQAKAKTSGETEPTGAERRRSHREPVFTIGRISCVDSDGVCNHEVLVTDVSLHGCGFRCNVELDESGTYE
ncbi:MAG TPA: PilZ domain-containing protein, partial [Tepidisphaeraceae bacterium]|nr:PilZ domain-containing protein [Tepidisphaeraceae bacterium]